MCRGSEDTGCTVPGLLRTTEPSKFPLLREEGERESASEEVLKSHGVRNRANPTPSLPTTPLCTAWVCHQQPAATIPERRLSGKDADSTREGSASPRDFPGRGFRSCSVATSERVTGLQGNETTQMQISKETQPDKALWTASLGTETGERKGQRARERATYRVTCIN